MECRNNTPTDGSWMGAAECRGADPTIMHPETANDERIALSICKDCVVIDECLEYALEHHELFGVWGGTTEKQRRKMLGVYTRPSRRSA